MDVQLYKNILDTLDSGYSYCQIIFGANQTDNDYSFLMCNNHFADKIGFSCNEITSNKASDIKDESPLLKKIITLLNDFTADTSGNEYTTTINCKNSYYSIKLTRQSHDELIVIISDTSDKISFAQRTSIDMCQRIQTNVCLIHPRTGKILFANQKACEFYGYTEKEITNLTLYDLTLPTDLSMEYNNLCPSHDIVKLSVDELLAASKEHGKGHAYFMHQTKSGEKKEVLINLNCSQIYDDKFLFTVIMDRTAIYKMARSLNQKHEQYKILFDEAPLGYQILDEECNIVSVNQEWLDMLGYSHDEVINKSFHDFIAEESLDIIRIEYKKRQKLNAKNINITINLYKKNKEKITVGLRGRIILNDKSEFIQCHCIINDITPLIRAQEQQKLLIKAKRDFLAMISHEVRTPLTTILGLNQLLMKTDLNDEQKDYHSKIANAGGNLLGIINDMLDITKYESGKLDVESLPFNFENFINNIVTVHKMRTEKCGNKFEYFVDNAIPNYLIGDALRLSQVLNNILSNANKFTHMGKIKLSVRLMGRSNTNADIQIIIRDDGIGMTEDHLKKLFIPFEQADASFSRKYGGTGLGMVISKQLIDLMGGEIKVESIHSEGTIFIISLTLPIKLSKDEMLNGASSESHVKKQLKKLSGKHVLVVEDHKINQKIICEILKFYDLEIDVASNGIEAINKVKDRCYELIFMDIQMPAMDGFTATEQIRSLDDECSKNTPILAMTAHAMEEEYNRCIECGMNGHITKPINISYLEECLIKYLGNGETSPSAKSTKKSNLLDFSSASEKYPIDVRLGLIRFHHDASSYKDALNDFLTYKNTEKTLIKLKTKHKLEQIVHYLHALKGVSANLSMDILSKAAHELKQHIKKFNEFSQEKFNELICKLNEVICVIESEDVFNRIDEVMHKHVKS